MGEEEIDFTGLYDPMKMIESAIKALPRIYNGGKSTFYWVAVKDLFGYGSTTSVLLCKHFKIEPYSELQDHL